MLYADSSVVVKQYLEEPGSKVVRTRCESGERIFTSVISYAEIWSVFGRKQRNREFAKGKFEYARRRFESDWNSSIQVLELDAQSMGAIASLVLQFPLKAADAIHLSAALSLRDLLRTSSAHPGETVEFAVAEKALARIAEQCGLRVFNPEG